MLQLVIDYCRPGASMQDLNDCHEVRSKEKSMKREGEGKEVNKARGVPNGVVPSWTPRSDDIPRSSLGAFQEGCKSKVLEERQQANRQHKMCGHFLWRSSTKRYQRYLEQKLLMESNTIAGIQPKNKNWSTDQVIGQIIFGYFKSINFIATKIS